jgi:hypothetical protein
MKKTLCFGAKSRKQRAGIRDYPLGRPNYAAYVCIFGTCEYIPECVEVCEVAKFSATQLDIFLAVVLFLVGLGYSVSGLPASIIVACVIWGTAWLFFSHLFFIYDGTASCPTDVKIILWGGATFLLVIILAAPVRVQYAKEHTPPSVPQTPPVSPLVVTPEVRSYIVFDGSMRFGEKKDYKGQLIADRNLQVGDEFAFDFYFRATGPNPVDLVSVSLWLYVEPDFQDKTQRDMIEAFKQRLSAERKRRPGKSEASTFMPGERRFDTAYAKSEPNEHRIVTQDDLNALRNGTEIAFVIVEIAYMDDKKLHHLRTCQWLTPPAIAPGVWHFCEGFTKSD